MWGWIILSAITILIVLIILNLKGARKSFAIDEYFDTGFKFATVLMAVFVVNIAWLLLLLIIVDNVGFYEPISTQEYNIEVYQNKDEYFIGVVDNTTVQYVFSVYKENGIKEDWRLSDREVTTVIADTPKVIVTYYQYKSVFKYFGVSPNRTYELQIPKEMQRFQFISKEEA